MEIFDSMVDEILNGETFVADFDTGITLTMDMETVGICYEDEDSITDIIIGGEEVETLHLMLEALFVARQNLKNVNWDDLLIGT